MPEQQEMRWEDVVGYDPEKFEAASAADKAALYGRWARANPNNAYNRFAAQEGFAALPLEEKIKETSAFMRHHKIEGKPDSLPAYRKMIGSPTQTEVAEGKDAGPFGWGTQESMAHGYKEGQLNTLAAEWRELEKTLSPDYKFDLGAEDRKRLTERLATVKNEVAALEKEKKDAGYQEQDQHTGFSLANAGETLQQGARAFTQFIGKKAGEASRDMGSKLEPSIGEAFRKRGYKPADSWGEELADGASGAIDVATTFIPGMKGASFLRELAVEPLVSYVGGELSQVAATDEESGWGQVGSDIVEGVDLVRENISSGRPWFAGVGISDALEDEAKELATMYGTHGVVGGTLAGTGNAYNRFFDRPHNKTGQSFIERDQREGREIARQSERELAKGRSEREGTLRKTQKEIYEEKSGRKAADPAEQGWGPNKAELEADAIRQANLDAQAAGKAPDNPDPRVVRQNWKDTAMVRTGTAPEGSPMHAASPDTYLGRVKGRGAQMELEKNRAIVLRTEKEKVARAEERTMIETVRDLKGRGFYFDNNALDIKVGTDANNPTLRQLLGMKKKKLVSGANDAKNMRHNERARVAYLNEQITAIEDKLLKGGLTPAQAKEGRIIKERIRDLINHPEQLDRLPSQMDEISTHATDPFVEELLRSRTATRLTYGQKLGADLQNLKGKSGAQLERKAERNQAIKKAILSAADVVTDYIPGSAFAGYAVRQAKDAIAAPLRKVGAARDKASLHQMNQEIGDKIADIDKYTAAKNRLESAKYDDTSLARANKEAADRVQAQSQAKIQELRDKLNSGTLNKGQRARVVSEILRIQKKTPKDVKRLTDTAEQQQLRELEAAQRDYDRVAGELKVGDRSRFKETLEAIETGTKILSKGATDVSRREVSDSEMTRQDRLSEITNLASNGRLDRDVAQEYVKYVGRKYGRSEATRVSKQLLLRANVKKLSDLPRLTQ